MSSSEDTPGPDGLSTASTAPTAPRSDAEVETEVDRRMRAAHSVEIQWLPGAVAWFCACGARSAVSGGYRTERQVRAASDRHLRAARQRTRSEVLATAQE